jgi:hypothetical protein
MRTPFLQAILKDEYPSSPAHTCSKCGDDGTYRCLDCFGSNLFCSPCILLGHQNLPLHRIERWDEGSFERTSLAHLSLPVYIGHRGHNGAQCPHGTVPTDVVVIHTNGIHTINAHFCPLKTSNKATILVESKLFPASLRNPRTVFTFDMLRTFQMINFESRTSMWDYYDSLVRLTNNVIPSSVPVSC